MCACVFLTSSPPLPIFLFCFFFSHNFTSLLLAIRRQIRVIKLKFSNHTNYEHTKNTRTNEKYINTNGLKHFDKRQSESIVCSTAFGINREPLSIPEFDERHSNESHQTQKYFPSLIARAGEFFRDNLTCNERANRNDKSSERQHNT